MGGVVTVLRFDEGSSVGHIIFVVGTNIHRVLHRVGPLTYSSNIIIGRIGGWN